MAELQEITVCGQRILYRTAGTGPVVILLHCSSSHSGQWVLLIENLSSDFTVLAPDLHGYGRSDALPDDGRPYFEHDCRMVGALAGKWGAPVHLVGHSLGGTVALHMALKAPELVASLCLIEPVQFSLLEETGAPEQAEFHEISAATTALIEQGKTLQAARQFVDYWVSDGAFDVMDAKTQNYVERTIAGLTREWVGVSLKAPGQIRVGELAGISRPCVIVRGGATRASARAVSEILHQNIAGSRLHVIPDIGHMGAASEPLAVNVKIAGFLRDQAVPARAGDGKDR